MVVARVGCAAAIEDLCKEMDDLRGEASLDGHDAGGVMVMTRGKWKCCFGMMLQLKRG